MWIINKQLYQLIWNETEFNKTGNAISSTLRFAAKWRISTFWNGVKYIQFPVSNKLGSLVAIVTHSQIHVILH